MTERGISGGAHPVDTAAFCAGLTTALRRAGVPTSPDRAGRLAEALRLLPPADRTTLYWACRVVLVSDRQQLPVFDAVFAAVFGGAAGWVPDPAEHRGDPNHPPWSGEGATERPTGASSPSDHRPVPQAALPPGVFPGLDGAGSGAGPSRESVLLMASGQERLHHTSFAELTEEETAVVRQLVRRIVLSTPVRDSRRTRRSARSSSRLDIRRTARTARRNGPDATRLVFAQRRPKPRRLVLLCDVSGSMESYTRVFLSLLQGAAAGARAEAFVFSTRLTRLTRQLAVRDPDIALARAAAEVRDWAGGTRLAESLHRFIDDYGRQGMARGAVVVIMSDGWAQDDPAEVAAQMQRLRRLAYRIIWINPRKVAVDYQPLAGGMAAALPYCDAFVSGHSYTALSEVAAAIRSDRSQGSGPQFTHQFTRQRTR